MSQLRDAEIGKEYDDLSPEELKEALRTVYFGTDEITEETMAELDRIMAALDEKDPLEEGTGAEEAWAVFQAEHREELSQIGVQNNDTDKEVGPNRMVSGRTDRRKSTKVLMRIGLVAALVVVMLFAVAAVAGARGFDLWGWSPKWTREDLRFETEEPSVQDKKDIPTALTALGIDEPLYPSWLPEDMVRVGADVQLDPVLLYEAYCGNGRDLLITIVPSSISDTAVYQRSESKPEEYIAGNTIHYIFHDVEQVSAVWYTENYTALIVGDISDDEMKNIINSVYEVS